MVNVLSKSKKKQLYLRYYTRLATLVFFGTAIAFFIGAVSLIPSYFASKEQVDAVERYRDAIDGTLGLKQRNDTEQQVQILSERVRIVENNQGVSFSKDFFENLLALKRTGVHIDGIMFTQTDTGVQVTLTGISDLRSELLAFADELRHSVVFVDVSLPVSQLVSEEDVSFAIKTEYRGQ